MNETKTLINKPLFQVTENFLTSDECLELINFPQENLKMGSIINALSGISEIDKSYRRCYRINIPSEHELTKIIYNKISDKLGIDKSRFDEIEIVKYNEGEFFENHNDFFITTTGKNHFSEGGQRVGTVIMYLNDDMIGGETFFPQLRLIQTPVTGKMIYFKYDYDNDINLKTVHKAMPLDQGEKWIATVWIKEFPRTQICEDYVMKDNIIKFHEVEYELDCLVTSDTRTLRLTLPTNYFPENTILVKVSTDSSSMLLLYLIVALNFNQSIPYYILPIITDDYTQCNIDSINRTIDNIKNRTSSKYILDAEIYNQSIDDIFLEKSKDRFYKYDYVFIDENETNNIDKSPNQSFDFLLRPFDNLLQSHITWAIDELNLSDIIL